MCILQDIFIISVALVDVRPSIVPSYPKRKRKRKKKKEKNKKKKEKKKNKKKEKKKNKKKEKEKKEKQSRDRISCTLTSIAASVLERFASERVTALLAVEK
jgi:outer membrane biosynthesis protein TonB